MTKPSSSKVPTARIVRPAVPTKSRAPMPVKSVNLAPGSNPRFVAPGGKTPGRGKS